MIALGVVLIILGFVFPALHILWTIGVIVCSCDRRGAVDPGLLWAVWYCRQAPLLLGITVYCAGRVDFFTVARHASQGTHRFHIAPA